MKKIVFNASVTASALAAGVFSFATIPEGRALSEQERIVSRGLYTQCQGCYEKKGCNDAQPIPTTPGEEAGATVLICKGTPKVSRYADWSQTQELDHASDVQTCKGTIYTWKLNDQNQWVWAPGRETSQPGCGTYTECNDREGGWSQGPNGEVIDGRQDYRKQCDKIKPPPGE